MPTEFLRCLDTNFLSARPATPSLNEQNTNFKTHGLTLATRKKALTLTYVWGYLSSWGLKNRTHPARKIMYRSGMTYGCYLCFCGGPWMLLIKTCHFSKERDYYQHSENTTASFIHIDTSVRADVQTSRLLIVVLDDFLCGDSIWASAKLKQISRSTTYFSAETLFF